VSYESLLTLPGAKVDALDEIDSQVRQQLEIAAKYQGYIDRQQEEVERQRGQENTTLPQDMDYRDVHGLSIEVRQKLNAHRPETIGQASRISGVTPAAISLLLVYLKRKSRAKSSERAA
jgi:tRNA uridine 5-carboxymethylaminomethyl modification enzyme